MKAAIRKLFEYAPSITGTDISSSAYESGNKTGVTQLHPAANVNVPIRIGIVAIVLVFGFLGAWAVFAPLSGAVMGQGFVKLDTNRKTVQHLEGGIIKEIRVRDGDSVMAGQVLVVIEDQGVSAGVNMLQGQLDALIIRAARLESERNEQQMITVPVEIADRLSEAEVSKLLQAETTYFESRRRTYLDQVDLLQKQASEANNELEGLSSQVEATRAALRLIEQEVEATGALEKQKFVQKFDLLSLQRGVQDYRVRLGEYVSEVSRTRQKILDLNLRTVGLRNEYITVSAQELADINVSIYDLNERLRPTMDVKRRQNIIAPISGTVVDMQVFTIGGVIAPRDRLMDIVQDDGDLIIETQIPVDSIDDVEVGQLADVRLSAYSARNTPLVLGKVEYVSADSLNDERTGASYYLTRIELDRDSLAEAGNDIILYPGMPAEVFIKTGDRTAMDYLLAPVTNSLRRSAREP